MPSLQWCHCRVNQLLNLTFLSSWSSSISSLTSLCLHICFRISITGLAFPCRKSVLTVFWITARPWLEVISNVMIARMCLFGRYNFLLRFSYGSVVVSLNASQSSLQVQQFGGLLILFVWSQHAQQVQWFRWLFLLPAHPALCWADLGIVLLTPPLLSPSMRVQQFSWLSLLIWKVPMSMMGTSIWQIAAFAFTHSILLGQC